MEASNYSVKEFEMLVRKYSYQGFEHFWIDTMKSEDAGNSNATGKLVQQSKRLHECARQLNVHILVSFQLASRWREIKKRELDESCLSQARQVIEVVDVCMMAREMYRDEYPNEKKEANVHTYKQDPTTKKWYEERVEIHHDREYRFVFLPKNRRGKKGVCVCLEFFGELGIFKEIGYARVSGDSAY